MMIQKECLYCSSNFEGDDKKIYNYCSNLCRSRHKFIEIKRGGKNIKLWRLNYEKYRDFYDSLEKESKNLNKCYICEKIYTNFSMCCSKECSVKMKEQSTLKTTGKKHNLSNGSISRKNMIAGLSEKYGVSNVFQRSDIKVKIKESWLVKYGFDNPSKNDEIKNKKRKSLEKNGYWMPREEWDERKIYEANVHEITWSQMKKFAELKFGRNIWNDIRESRNLPQKEWLTIDHKFSRNDGFINKVSPDVVGHICNLEIMTFQDNRNKWSNSSIRYEDLLEEIKKFDVITKNKK
jgi:hypothetical protein